MNPLLKVLLATVERNPELVFKVLRTMLDIAESDPALAKEIIALVSGYVKK